MSSSNGEVELRKVSVPSHRLKPLKKAWRNEIYPLVYNVMQIDIRMNLKTRKVELKTLPNTPNISNLCKCMDFIQAFVLGFDVEDARLLLQDDEDCEIYSFEITDVIMPHQYENGVARFLDNIGNKKSAIENATKTKIVIQDCRIVHILGARNNVKVAGDAIIGRCLLVSRL